MASATFDKLWDEAFEREGELVNNATVLARVYSITSAIEALRIARIFQEAGRPLFEYCETQYKAKQRYVLERMRRQGRLSDSDVAFIMELLSKSTKGW